MTALERPFELAGSWWVANLTEIGLTLKHEGYLVEGEKPGVILLYVACCGFRGHRE